MPLHLQHIFDQIPLPSLQYYTIISTSLFFGNIFYFHHLIQSNKNDSSIIINSINETIINGTINNQTIFYSIEKPFSFAYIRTLLSIIISQSFSLLILVNAIYCSIALVVKQLQILVFGELRLTELQRIKDKFWNYAFYKLCFLFGVLSLENLNELILWLSWFFILVIAILCCQLAKDQFELISVSVSSLRQTFIKILGLLISLLCLCSGLFTICFRIGLKYGGLSIFFFMLAETILLTLDISFLLFKYIFIQQQRNNYLQTSNEYRSNVMYYLEFLFDILTLSIDILHHLQMLFYHQTYMSMSSLIFFMQLKPLFNELTQRLKRHKLYRMAMIRMEKKYPLLTKYDLERKYRQQNYLSTLEEVCSICWEKFEKARRLPCGHLFHEICLRSWLEHDTTCPICRLSLHEDTIQVTPTNSTPIQSTSNFRFWPSLSFGGLRTNAHNLAINNDQNRGLNHLFRFHANRYSSWLPSFSIEMNHNFPFHFGRSRLTSLQLTSMVQNIQHIFPQIPFEIILSDLQRTQSIDTTIENIIEQRIHLESQQQETSESEESSYISSSSSSEIDELINTDLLLDSSRTIQNNEHFTWPLDPNLSFADRKQQLISYMRRQYLERERHLHGSSHILYQLTDQ
ncbi:unnamed protein product [Rotaria sp. Silwood1]|nr:unnamed protein product [Rotaria sp. Silwood1]CAF4861544.1 unnamed protein product [Rotaria sp. Silwood1]